MNHAWGWNKCADLCYSLLSNLACLICNTLFPAVKVVAVTFLCNVLVWDREVQGN